MRVQRRLWLFVHSLGLRATQSSSTKTPVSNSESRSYTPNYIGFQDPLSNYATGSVANMTKLAPVICISHGGGPMPLLGDPSHAEIVSSLKHRVPEILKLGTPDEPRAIVLVTAHWSTQVPTISSAAKHDLLFDYYGFPKEAYSLEYNAPGSPEVAALVESALREEGLEPKKDLARGWDHGVFIPMMLIHPKATIPIIQLSVLRSEDPKTHFQVGRALSKLRAENIAIVGSGFASLHNLRLMFSGIIETSKFKALNKEWSEAVTDAAQTAAIEERNEKFSNWRNWPGAYEMHPRGGGEHFLPLIVCAGAAGESQAKAYKDEFLGLNIWSYYWD